MVFYAVLAFRSRITATRAVIASDTGALSHTPSIPHSRDIRTARGTMSMKPRRIDTVNPDRGRSMEEKIRLSRC